MGGDSGLSTDVVCVDAKTDPASFHLDLKPELPFATPWGKFKVERQVGAGTFSKVWKASFSSADERRDVALKVYRATRSCSKAGRNADGARAEAQHLSKVQERFGVTPHIMEYLGYFCVEGTPAPHVVVVAELLGCSLLDRLHTMPRTEDGRVAGVQERRTLAGQVLRQMLLALAKLERLELAHCDVKPENILWSGANAEEGVWKLTDFNHCRECSNILAGAPVLNRPWQVGTGWYNAPELLVGYTSAMTPAVDVWGLVCTAGEVVCGRPLFAAGVSLASRGLHTAASFAVLNHVLHFTGQSISGGVVSRSTCRSLFFHSPTPVEESITHTFSTSSCAGRRGWSSTPLSSFSTNGITDFSDSIATTPPLRSSGIPWDTNTPSNCPSPMAPVCRAFPDGSMSFPDSATSPWRGGQIASPSMPPMPAPRMGELLPPEAAAQQLGVEAEELEDTISHDLYAFLFGRKVVGESAEGELFGDLVWSMLQVNAAERLSATQALRHPFFHPTLQGWQGKGAFSAYFREANRTQHDTRRTRHDLAQAALSAAQQVPPPFPTLRNLCHDGASVGNSL